MTILIPMKIRIEYGDQVFEWEGEPGSSYEHGTLMMDLAENRGSRVNCTRSEFVNFIYRWMRADRSRGPIRKKGQGPSEAREAVKRRLLSDLLTRPMRGADSPLIDDEEEDDEDV